MLAEVEFDVTLPATGEELRRNVQHALTLGLPDLRSLPPSGERLSIIANGPTARNFDQGLGSRTLALNGALKLFGACGPTWWAACDPQEMVAGFVSDAPADTTYLVASKCHPAVFDALKGRDALLWHLDEHAYWGLVSEREPIRVAPTITICSFELAERLGFSRFETWGWDACYFGQANHAVPQEHPDGVVVNTIGARSFPTTTSWMWEAQNAALRFEMTPRDVVIHGGGMMAAMLDHYDLLKDAA